MLLERFLSRPSWTKIFIYSQETSAMPQPYERPNLKCDLTNELRRSLLLSLKRAHQALLKHNESSLWRLYTISYAKWILSTFFVLLPSFSPCVMLPKLWTNLFICIFKKHCIYLHFTSNVSHLRLHKIYFNLKYASFPIIQYLSQCLQYVDE